MKLQSRVNRRVGNKEYRKYYVDLPTEIIKELGWKDSVEIEYDVKDDKIILKPKKKN